MKRAIILLLFLVACAFNNLRAQTSVSGTVADAETLLPLPFATVKHLGSSEGVITDLNGRFSISTVQKNDRITASYIGYRPDTVSAAFVDVIFLKPAYNTMGEVVITTPYEKIRRIINAAIRQKPLHNPDKYDWHRCHIYYKMRADLQSPRDSAANEEKKNASFSDTSYLLLSETYVKRYYQRPAKTQEIVLASRFSGLKKSLFTNLVTDVLPFHVYGDFIRLNEIDFLHPIADGWQSRYRFDIADELQSGLDTVYILKFGPKEGAVFNALSGTVYINTNGYAISHIIAHASDTATNSRSMKMEQVYAFTGGKWFPKELNYELRFNEFPDEGSGLVLSGHSIIDSVSFKKEEDMKFDKTHPIKLHRRMDDRQPEEWAAMRFEPLTQKEQNTYVFIDSISSELKLDKIMNIAGKSVTGKLPVGPIDIDLRRFLAYNTYEGTRLGLGLYTNDNVLRYVSVGGWFGYGFKDKVWKYGGSARIYPGGEKDHWLEAAYQKTYQNTGNINIHPELDRNGLRNWILARVDEVKEFSAKAHGRFGYWELELEARSQELRPRYDYTFNAENTNNRLFNHQEAAINIRYAFGERRTPMFGMYLPLPTKYPIAYFRLSGGSISSGNYTADYGKVLAALSYGFHINRWGKDNFRLDAGLVKTRDEAPLPRSFLMAGNGFRIDEQIQIYAWGGFMTFAPYTYFSDKFVSLMYRHDFDRHLYQHKYSRPFISLAHNILWGGLNQTNKTANTGVETPGNGYHETGFLLNQLFRLEYLNMAYINFDAGLYYNWQQPFKLNKNARIVVGISAGL